MQTEGMRRYVVCLATILLAGAACADWSPEQQELISLSDEWIAAEVGHDKRALERILDERFLATFASSGKTIDRSAYIEWIMQSKIEPFQVLNEVVNIHGDAALVIATSTNRSPRIDGEVPMSSNRMPILAHVVYRTRRFGQMLAWYKEVFHATVQHQNPLIAFLTYDDEHHRFAFIA